MGWTLKTLEEPPSRFDKIKVSFRCSDPGDNVAEWLVRRVVSPGFKPNPAPPPQRFENSQLSAQEEGQLVGILNHVMFINLSRLFARRKGNNIQAKWMTIII